MATKITPEAAEARRNLILQSARWCFLNFGFSKTSLDDIARKATISRTLLYRTFKDKEDIFVAVFAHWLVSRQPDARVAAAGSGAPLDRLRAVCRLLVQEPWEDMVGAPMAAEFLDVCERIEPQISLQHREVVHECVDTILRDTLATEVFVLALHGLIADVPAPDLLDARIRVLAERFVAARQEVHS